MRAVVLGVVSGLLYCFAFPPIGAGAVAFVALVPLLAGVRAGGIAAGALTGWVAGTVACNGLTSASILAALLRAGHPVGLAAVEAFVVPQLCGALWFAAFGACAAALERRDVSALRYVLVLSAAWVAFELGRSRVGGGMPWVLLGHSQASAPTLLQIADVTGTFGVSFVVALANAACAIIVMRRPSPGVALVVAGVLVAGAVAYGRVQIARWERPGGSTFDVALVQPAVPEAWRESLPRQPDVVMRYRTLVERAAAGGSRLVVLPENAVSVSADTNPQMIADVARALAQSDALLLIGGPRAVSTDPGRAAVRNSAYLVDARGVVREVYDKMRLVPFGEAPPPWPVPTSRAADDYGPGDTATLLHAGDAVIAPAICWEGIYPDGVAALVRRGATLLASLSNDDWFGGRAAMDQHFQATLVRAVETRRWLVRATNSGITAIVDPRGIATTAPTGEATVLAGRVTLETALTPYVRFGDVFAWVCCIIAAAGLVGRREGE